MARDVLTLVVRRADRVGYVPGGNKIVGPSADKGRVVATTTKPSDLNVKEEGPAGNCKRIAAALALRQKVFLETGW